MEDRKITEQESLDLIARMIRNTQNKLAENSGRPFLFFGYTSVAFALVIWILLRTTGVWQWGFLWFALPIIMWPIVARMYQRMRHMETYTDRVIKYIWILMCITIITACAFTLFFPRMESLFFTGLLLGMGTALTGLILRIRAITLAGVAGFVLSPVALWIQSPDQLPLLAVILTLVFVVPGHILNRKSKAGA